MLSKKRVSQLILACSLAVSGNAYAAQSSAISVELNYWQPALSGDSDMRMPGSSNVNLKNDLHLDKTNSLSLSVNYKENATRQWYLSGDGAEIQKTTVLSKPFRANTANFNSGDNVRSELKVSHYQLGLRQKWSERSNFYTNYQLNRTSVKTSIANNSNGGFASRDQAFTSVGVGLGWETKNSNAVNFFAEINPLSLCSASGYWEQKIGIKTAIGPTTNFTLGYKAETIRVGKDNANDRSQLDLRGLYFNLGGRF